MAEHRGQERTVTNGSTKIDGAKVDGVKVDASTLSRMREADWPAVLFFIHIHLLALYGVWLVFTEVKLLTILFCGALCLIAITGVTSGAHRLWAHRTYRANTALRVALALAHSLLGQGSIYDWVQLHRLHHAQLGTDGDPFDHNRGFLFSHILTHFRSLSPYQQHLLRQIDMSDLEQDSVVILQKRFYYWVLYPVLFLLLPINAPVEYWGDSILNSIFVLGFLRYAVVLHAAWLVHSATHIWGLQPHDKYPADTNMVFVLTKSYWPHYHYLMPYDYKSGEYGSYGKECSTALIRVWAALGWATQLRTMDSAGVRAALAASVRSDTPVAACLAREEARSALPEDHFLSDS